MVEKLELALALVGALGTVCSLLANLLPDGKWKTAASYVGVRLLKAREVLGSDGKK